MTSWSYNNPHFEANDFKSPWYGHTYFAYDLVSNLKFKKVVELGSFTGCSFFSFCQAVKDNQLESELIAIDTWKGDKHSGFYNEDVFNEFKNKQSKFYSEIKAKFLRLTFDEAVTNFKDGEIDLLHIDGLHTYQAVKHDFLTWLPKVNSNGIILLHDIHEKTADFGVFKFWEELKQQYKTLEFSHSHGLGVVFLNEKIWKEYGSLQSLWANYYQLKSEFNFQKEQLLNLEQKIAELDFSKKPLAKLYLDFENGFSEDFVEIVNLENFDDSELVFDLSRFKGKTIKALRFDPANTFVDLDLNHIKLNTENQVITLDTIETGGVKMKIPTNFHFEIKTPQIILNNFEPNRIQQVKISLKYNQIGEEVLHNKILELTNKSYVTEKKLENLIAENTRLEQNLQDAQEEATEYYNLYSDQQVYNLELANANENLRHQVNNYVNQNTELEKYIKSLKGSLSFRIGFGLTFIFRKLYDSVFVKKPYKIDPKKLFKNSKFKIKSRLPIDIIIPVYNGFEYLEPLFASIKKNTTSPYRLIIINDASPDSKVAEFLESIKTKFDNCLVLTNQKNLGFVQTVNKGMRETKNHFVILNTDTEVPNGWLERLMQPILSQKNIATTTPFTNAGTICSFPNFLEDNTIFEDLDLDTIDRAFRDINYPNSELEIPTGVGFCMGMNKDVVNKIGLFNDEVFARGYGEENDWCRRAVKAGFKNLLVPNLFVYHKHGGSFTSEEKQQLINRNQQLLNQIHPEYNQVVAEYIAKNPLDNLRKIIVFKILASCKTLYIASKQENADLNTANLTIRGDVYDLKYKNYSLTANPELFKNLSFNTFLFSDYNNNQATKIRPKQKTKFKKKILILDHNLGGGANFYSRQKIKEFIAKKYLVYRVYFNHYKKLFVLTSLTSELEIGIEFNSLNELENLISIKKIEKLIVNELVSYPNGLEVINLIQYWKNKFKFQLTFLLHDYYAICPNFTLFDAKDKHCNVPDLKQCKTCLPKLKFDPGLAINNKTNLKIWRKNWLKLLQLCDEIICFSTSSQKILIKAYPALQNKQIQIIPHKVDYIEKVNNEYKNLDPNLNIAVLGHIFSKEKGAYILKDIAKKLESDKRIKFYILGGIIPECKTDNMVIFGEYKQQDLAKIMLELKIDLVFIPSIWVETFSYTTNEAINLGLPVLTFNLGAQAEYVKKYKNGYTIDKINSEEAIKTIMKTYDNIKNPR